MINIKEFFIQIEDVAKSLDYNLYQISSRNQRNKSYRLGNRNSFENGTLNYIHISAPLYETFSDIKNFDIGLKYYPVEVLNIFSIICKNNNEYTSFIIKNNKNIFLSARDEIFSFIKSISNNKKEFIRNFKMLPKSAVTIFSINAKKIGELTDFFNLTFEEKDNLIFDFFHKREKQFSKNLNYHTADKLRSIKDFLLEVYDNDVDKTIKYLEFLPLLKEDSRNPEDINIFKENSSISIFIDLKKIFTNFPIAKWSMKYNYIPKIEQICHIIKDYYQLDEIIINNHRNKIFNITYFQSNNLYSEEKLKNDFIAMMLYVQKNNNISRDELKDFFKSYVLKHSLEKKLSEEKNIKKTSLNKI